ncbi:protein translocase subunit SecD [Gordonia sp. (in: high G+C Gram-positive bacteria)]|uniref:protein translocase subunit SecD n=1 Tax=Gordonia sp. (in: high G+C Gram-positive bacteria) TaxID=84139 RepID=UPI0016A5B08B|nr:protein translocase subunit SecD [Gordonia sp. (in: high G+C Gram-positive bacteria)]NLG47500.1 protein translocase subunit SecD [Gordonia sp. (in: high G+C Gram-positive bacteria)]
MTKPNLRAGAGKLRPERPPWQPLTVFFALLAIVYGLVFFTGDGSPTPKLGIDLQGGTRVVLTARTDDGKAPSAQQLDQARQIIDQRVNGLGVGGSEVVVNGDTIVITVPGDDGKQARDLGQTARLYIRPVVEQVPAQEQKPDPNAKDVSEMTPDEQKAAVEAERALRQAPANADQATLDKLRAQMAKLDCSPNANDPLIGHDRPNEYLVACGDGDGMVYLLEPMLIDGREIADAKSGQNSTGAWTVNVDFKGDAQKTWADYTGKNVGKQTAVTLDTRVLSAPSINVQILGTTEISGRFTQGEADALANALKYGSLPLSFSMSDAQTVSATLGLHSLNAGLIAGLVGLILILIYSLLYYRAMGFLSVLSLILAYTMVYGIIVLLGRWIGFTLDLAGIAGLIIGLGMTADSFVVYFERIKDEMREGRTVRSAVTRGWQSARRTVWTGNAVSFICAAIIYLLAVGAVRGFAFTLGLTTLIDIMIVFLVTHPMVVLASRNKFLSKPSINGLGAVSEVARVRRQVQPTASAAGVSAGHKEGDAQ